MPNTSLDLSRGPHTPYWVAFHFHYRCYWYLVPTQVTTIRPRESNRARGLLDTVGMRPRPAWLCQDEWVAHFIAAADSHLPGAPLYKIRGPAVPTSYYVPPPPCGGMREGEEQQQSVQVQSGRNRLPAGFRFLARQQRRCSFGYITPTDGRHHQ